MKKKLLLEIKFLIKCNDSIILILFVNCFGSVPHALAVDTAVSRI